MSHCTEVHINSIAVAENNYKDFDSRISNYLAISKLEVGLLVNFHEKSLDYKRIVLSK